MKKFTSVLLALVMAVSILSAFSLNAVAAGNYIPKTIKMTQTGGQYSVSYSDGTLTARANGTPIDHGLPYAFIALADVSTQNRNIMITEGNDEIKYAMANVCRSGKVKKIVLHNYVDHYNSSTDTINIKASGGRVTQISHSVKRYYKGGSDSQQPSTSVYTYTYNDAGDLTKINWHAGSEAEKTTFTYDASGRLVSSTWTCGVGKDVVTNFVLDAQGRVTRYGRLRYAYDSKGQLTKNDTFTYTYNDKGCITKVVDHDVDNKAAATFNYTYQVI